MIVDFMVDIEVFTAIFSFDFNINFKITGILQGNLKNLCFVLIFYADAVRLLTLNSLKINRQLFLKNREFFCKNSLHL